MNLMDWVMTFDDGEMSTSPMTSGNGVEAQVLVVDIERVEAELKKLVRAEGKEVYAIRTRSRSRPKTR